jgi:hypothetical protein
MSLTTLTTEAMEEGSYFITVAFFDEDGNAETPNADTIKWTLTDMDGTVINDRYNEAETSDTSIVIELEGDDLEIQSGETAPIVRRRVTVLWEYDSDLGNDKPAKAEVIFPLRNLTRIPAAVAP